ncbi:MAG: Crp/Fnr family transcriptional regulator [Gammaproteobacteria bacterium]|nr:Crp/Fnr family transcriptional regulator [Gammaproteobacteria bacterium]
MNSKEKLLLKSFRNLNEDDQYSLLKFAEFLAQQEKNMEVLKALETPIAIAPKKNETVVGALKRLSTSYFMLDKAVMLNETSAIMAQHILQGRERDEVIEELEQLFKAQYAKLEEAQR